MAYLTLNIHLTTCRSGLFFRIEVPDPKISVCASVVDLKVVTEPSQMILHEWVQIVRLAGSLAQLGNGHGRKAAVKEQRQMESAFLENTSTEEAAYLSAWRVGATRAASQAVAQFTEEALAAAKQLLSV
jgi:hypothetical protein